MWNSRRWVWGLWAGAPALAGVAVSALLPVARQHLFAEHGLLELTQAGIWVLAICSAPVVALAVHDRRGRWGTIALGVLACLALARELDAHIYLNPETLGPWGVRYRIDWWMDGSVPIVHKALWVGVGLVVGFALLFPIWMSRGKPRLDQARLRLFILSVVFLIGGFVFDDLLRGYFRGFTGQAMEECAELIGVMFYLGAVLAPEPAEKDARRSI